MCLSRKKVFRGKTETQCLYAGIYGSYEGIMSLSKFVSVIVLLSFLLISCEPETPISQGGVAIPKALVKAATIIPNGVLSAYLQIDGGSRIPMNVDLVNGVAQIDVNVNPGNHTITIEFEFLRDGTTQAVVLARTSQNVTAESGNNIVNVNPQTYSFPDDDDDNIPNITELVIGSNPNRKNGSFGKIYAPGINITNPVNLFNGDDSYVKQQFLYTAKDISASGVIHGISLKNYATVSSATECQNLSVRMGVTTRTALVSTFSNNINNGVGSLTTVLDSATINFPPKSSNENQHIRFDQPYFYNGKDNLVVEVERDVSCNGILLLRAENTAANVQLSTNNASATGSLAGSLPHITFHFATGDNRVVRPAGAQFNNAIPFQNDMTNRTQLLYYSQEIQGEGPISAIGLPIGLNGINRTPAEKYVISIEMGHSTATGLQLTYSRNYSERPALVASNYILNMPGNIPDGELIWIPISGFSYNGTNNLVIDIQVTTASGSTFLKLQSAVDQRRSYGATVNQAADGLENFIVPIALRFSGGSVNVITDGSIPDTQPFAAFANRRQYLFKAAELGVSGTVNKIAHRLHTQTSFSIYNQCSVVLGHTEIIQLGNVSFSGHMSNPVEVFSGSFTISGGLAAGDWIEMPLSTPFVYDGSRGLVVEMSCVTGGTQNLLRGSNSDPLRYANRKAVHNSSAAVDTPTGVLNNMIDFRIWVD